MFKIYSNSKYFDFYSTYKENTDSFRRYNRIPGILGLIDCFKVAFNRPIVDEEAFYNHNAGTSMNVQVVSKF